MRLSRVSVYAFLTWGDIPLEPKLTYHEVKLVSEDEMMNFDMILKWLYIGVVLNPIGSAIFV